MKMVQDGVIRFKSEPCVTTVEEVMRFALEELKDSDREVVGVINLTNKLDIINWNTVSIGGLDKAIFSPRDVFKSSILSNSYGIHCHPDGSCTPSGEDLRLTRRLAEAGNVLGIPLLDHVIVACGRGDDARKKCLSLKEEYPEIFCYGETE